LTEQEKNKSIIRILDRRSRNQRLLSPAESINSLTVGALFADGSHFVPDTRQVLPCSDSLPSPVSAMGRGVNRSIKPDLLAPGGRSTLLPDLANPNLAHWRGANDSPPGILAAKPVVVAGGGSKVGYSYGTSNAAALTSHNAVHCYDILDTIFLDEIGSGIPVNHAAVLIKAMLAHGASWGQAADIIRNALGVTGRAADEIHKWLGYGVPDISRVEECVKNRVTMIGYGDLAKDSAHVFDLPLPFDFHVQKMYRRLTVTLAYFTPIMPNTQRYRTSQLWFTIDNSERLKFKRIDASDKAVARGTLQHEIFESNSAVVWNENDSLQIKVNCREDAGALIGNVPYAILATFEIAEEFDIDVYARVLEKVKQKESITLA
jgi:hypothetical protein